MELVDPAGSSNPRSLIAEADVAAAARGDRQAYARMVQASQGWVHAIALATVRDLGESQDVAQEVFLAAWKGLPVLRNPASFVPWLRQLTRNRATERLRRDGPQRWVRGEDAREALERAESPSETTLEVLLAREERALLEAALGELDAESREVVILYYQEGQSTQQVAALLGMKEAAVRKRLSRARQQLHARLDERTESALAGARPAPGFAASVIAALPSLGSAKVGAAAGIASAGLKAVFGSPFFPMWGGALLGALVRVMPEYRRSRSDAERFQLRRYLLANLIFALGSILAFWGAWHGPSRPLSFAVLWVLATAGLYVLKFVKLARIVAPREAVERAEEPGAAVRQRRHHRMRLAGFFAGSLLMCALLQYLAQAR